MTEKDELVERLESGELRLYELEEVADPSVAADARRSFIESQAGVSLETIGSFDFSADKAQRNIENLIGGIQVPLGVAGPIDINGSYAEGSYHLPLSTTEGALVASVNRGCSVINAAGGSTVRIFKAGMTRAPVYRVEDAAAAERFITWVDDNESEIREVAESTTNHGELIGIDPYVVGDNVFLRFTYDTKDAMGMNMVTVATRAAVDHIESSTDATLIALSGNLCTDKKPAAINAIEGRGYTVSADVIIPHDVVEERLKVPPEVLAEVNTRKNHIGSAKAGSYGFNAQAANVIAAMFLATGQDEAQVVEGSNTITTVDPRDDGLYVSVTLASLEVGTVGGGTHLATQREALELIGLHGGGDPPGSHAKALAEVIAGATLAGELSLLGALGSRHLAEAHERLGR